LDGKLPVASLEKLSGEEKRSSGISYGRRRKGCQKEGGSRGPPPKFQGGGGLKSTLHPEVDRFSQEKKESGVSVRR